MGKTSKYDREEIYYTAIPEMVMVLATLGVLLGIESLTNHFVETTI